MTNHDDDQQPPPQTYELADEVEQDSAPAKLSHPDPRLADPDLSEPAGEPQQESEEGEEEDRPRPKLLEGIPEPKFVDPEVKATRREDFRVRAAEEASTEAAKKRRTQLIVLGIVLLMGGAVWWWFVFRG